MVHANHADKQWPWHHISKWPRLDLAVLDLYQCAHSRHALGDDVCCLCYRLQGAYKIVIYDDASEDNFLLLQDLYHQHRHYLMMYPISLVDANFSDAAEYAVRLEKQIWTKV